jgi:hypothetical protein
MALAVRKTSLNGTPHMVLLIFNSILQCSGSESGSTNFRASRIRIRILLSSFYHQEKIVRKTLILAVLLFPLDFLSLKNNVKYLQKVKSRKTFFYCFLMAGSGKRVTSKLVNLKKYKS